MIWINFKIYKQTFGNGALKLAKICKEVSDQTKTPIVPVVSALDLRIIKEKIGGEVWLQNVDLFTEGKHTGYISPLAAVAAGASGILLNHSEHQIPPGKIRQILKMKDLKFMICLKTLGQVLWLKRLKPKPDFVAYEPPELIGGELSVSQAKPEVIKRIVKTLSDYQIIVGAGVHDAQDVKKSLTLGAKGALVSSDVVTAKDPKKELLELAKAFEK